MEEIKQLLAITQKLRNKYIHLNKQFSLDGKLVGDIGEVLAAEKYGLELYKENEPIHDGYEISTHREVQIKASFKNYCYFPFGEDKVPDFFLALNITQDGDLEELFNGPGQFIVENYIKARNLKPYNKTFYTLSKGVLLELNSIVPNELNIRKL